MPVAPPDPSISWQLRKVGPTGLTVRHGTYDPPPARNRHTSTHKFSSDGNDHIPAGDLHTDRAGIHRPGPARIGHMGTQAVGGGIGTAGSALTAPAANTLSSPPPIPAPLKSGPARTAAPAAPPTPPSKTPLGVSAPANAGRGPSSRRSLRVATQGGTPDRDPASPPAIGPVVPGLSNRPVATAPERVEHGLPGSRHQRGRKLFATTASGGLYENRFRPATGATSGKVVI